MASNITALDVQSRVCNDAIDKAQKYMGVTCEKMGSINRKQAKIRDRGDELAHSFVEYAVKELPSMQAGLDGFSKHISDVQDYRQAYIDQIDQKVLPILTDYGKKCKDAKKDLKKFETDRNKERKKIDAMSKSKNTGQLYGQATNWAQTQNELGRLTESVKRSTKLLEESILKFEEKRLHDLKQSLMEYCRIEMTFAAKCLEQWSSCYQKMAKVNPGEDMIVFQQSLQPYKLTERLGVNSIYGNGTDSTLANQLQNTSLSQPQMLTPSAHAQSQQSMATPITSVNRSGNNTGAHSTSVTQMSGQNGNHLEDSEEISEEEESEYETETDEETAEIEETASRPSGSVRTGWN